MRVLHSHGHSTRILAVSPRTLAPAAMVLHAQADDLHRRAVLLRADRKLLSVLLQFLVLQVTRILKKRKLLQQPTSSSSTSRQHMLLSTTVVASGLLA